MNVFKAKLDTRHQNGVIATVTQFDNAVLELQVLTDGVIDEAWEQPQFELIAMKRDNNPVREVEQDKFTILSKEEHRVQIELKEQFLTCRGTVKMQLVIKEGSRLSTTLFYLSIGQSLDHDIVDSHRDVAVLDELEAYIKQGFDDLAYQEQRMEAVEQSTNDLNDTMNANEAKRNKAETIRQEVFDTNEANRTRTFNSQVEEQKTAFSNSQTQRDESFNQSQQNMTQEFEASQRAREDEFDASQKSNQNTFSDNESKRQTTFAQSQRTNQEEFDQMMEDSRQTFDAAELKRQQLFDANEQVRGQNESRRVQNESQRAQAETQRAAAEVTRQQKMTQFEEKATQLSNDLDTQVARVDEFVTSNEGKLLGPNDKKDYMGNSHESVKEAMDANVDWLLGEINTVHYDGQHITATDSIEGRSKSAILKGNTLVNLSEKISTVTRNVTGWYVEEKILNDIGKLKVNTDYTVLYRLENISGNHENYNWIGLGIGANGFQKEISNIGSVVNKSGDWCKVKFQLTDSFIAKYPTYTKIYIRPLRRATAPVEGESITYTIKGFAILEGDYTTNTIPFNEVFEGMQSVKMPVLTATGKNLFDGKFIKYNTTYGQYHFGSGIYTYSISDNDTSIDLSNISFGDANGTSSIYWIISNGEIINNKRTVTNKNIVFYPNNEETFNKIKQRYNIQIEEGSVATEYEPYKTNILTVNEEVTLRGIGDVKDTLDLVTGEYVQRIGEIVLDGSENWSLDQTGNDFCKYIYSVSDGSILKPKDNDFSHQISDKLPSSYNGSADSVGKNSFCLWNLGDVRAITIYLDKTNGYGKEYIRQWLSESPITLQYQLATPTIKTVDLSDNHVYSYKGTTHYDCSSAEGSLVPTLSIDVPTNLPAVVARQRATIQELEKENVALKNEIVETAKSSVSGDLELMSSQFELDFRLFEIEMNLDMPMALNTRNARGAKAMAMTVYQQAKTLILAGKYEREDMEYKLNRYKSAGRITVEEYDELIALMDARELVD